VRWTIMIPLIPDIATRPPGSDLTWFSTEPTLRWCSLRVSGRQIAREDVYPPHRTVGRPPISATSTARSLIWCACSSHMELCSEQSKAFHT